MMNTKKALILFFTLMATYGCTDHKTTTMENYEKALKQCKVFKNKSLLIAQNQWFQIHQALQEKSPTDSINLKDFVSNFSFKEHTPSPMEQYCDYVNLIEKLNTSETQKEFLQKTNEMKSNRNRDLLDSVKNH